MITFHVTPKAWIVQIAAFQCMAEYREVKSSQYFPFPIFLKGSLNNTTKLFIYITGL